MRKTIITIIACVMLFGCVAVGVSAADEPVAPSAKPVALDIIPGPDIPYLTNEQTAKLQQIALEDEYVKEVLDGKDFTIESSGVCLNEGKVTGAFLLLSINDPFFIEFDWPTAAYNTQDGQGRYEKATYHEASVIDHLDIKVDLESSELISITPLNFHNRELERSILESNAKGGW